MKGKMEGADLLVVSDFQWMPLEEEVKDLIKKARQDGMKIYGLGIGSILHFEKSFNLADEKRVSKMKEIGETPDFLDGYQFFRDCDHKFVYANGKCSEIAEERAKKKNYAEADET